MEQHEPPDERLLQAPCPRCGKDVYFTFKYCPFCGLEVEVRLDRAKLPELEKTSGGEISTAAMRALANFDKQFEELKNQREKAASKKPAGLAIDWKWGLILGGVLLLLLVLISSFIHNFQKIPHR